MWFERGSRLCTLGLRGRFDAVSTNEILASQENNPVNCAKDCTIAAGMRFWLERRLMAILNNRLQTIYFCVEGYWVCGLGNDLAHSFDEAQ